jgi:hypothetical protein
MRRAKIGVIVLAAGTAFATHPPAALAQDTRPIAHTATIDRSEATLSFELSDGRTVTIAFADGIVRVNGGQVGGYRSAGAFELAWRDLVGRAGELSTPQLLDAVRALEGTELDSAELAALQSVQGAARADARVPGAAAVPPPAPAVQEIPDVRVEAAEAAEVAEAPGIGDVFGGALALIAALVGLTFMGFGMLFFAPKQLETVADTVWNRFWRSFLAGAFAQPLILPVFAMMIVGLALTVVGILVIPFAIAAFVVALALAVAGGYIAVARTVGEIYVRRKASRGGAEAGTWVSLRYIAYGLTALLAIWLPVVLFGWIPVVGTIATVTAVLITWILATAGFGATILSRGGMRGTIMRPLDRALADPDYWPTAESLPIARPPRSDR